MGWAVQPMRAGRRRLREGSRQPRPEQQQEGEGAAGGAWGSRKPRGGSSWPTRGARGALVALTALLGLGSVVVDAISKDAMLSKAACFGSYPRQLMVRKLQPGQAITCDGQLDEEAWAEVPWSEPFVDIEGDLGLTPTLQTRVKMRYSDQCLYVAARLEEPQAWATLTETNSVIYHDNDFEVFVDPNGDTQYYKEFEVNALGTTWNLLMVKPYIDGGPAVCNVTDPKQCAPTAPAAGVTETWDVTPGVKVGVQVNGTLNDPAKGSKDWTVELCLPLAEYAKYEPGVNVPPKDGDYWRINFSRVQHRVHVETRKDGTQVYVKDEGVPENNWVFSPMGVVNMHLPERWGYAYFTEQAVNRTRAARMRDGDTEEGPRDPLWPVKEALAQVYEAEKTYDALYGQSIRYTDSVNSLVLNGHLSDQVAQGYCTSQPKVVLTNDGNGFEVTIRSIDVPGVVGHIREDRKIWFTSDDSNGNGGNGGATSEKSPNKLRRQRRRLLRRD